MSESKSAPLRGLVSIAMANRGRIFAVYAAMALVVLAETGLNVWKPTLFVRQFGYSAHEIGLILGAVTLFGMGGGALVGGRLADRAVIWWGVRGRILFAAGLSGAMFVPLGLFLTGNAPAVITGIAIWNLGHGALPPQ